MPLSFTNVKLVSGTAGVTNASKTATLIAAPTSPARIRLVAAHLTCTLAATGAGGVIQLKDGASGTLIAQIDGNALTQHAELFFGEDGYPLSAGNLLQLVVANAGTNDASATCTATGFVVQ